MATTDCPGTRRARLVGRARHRSRVPAGGGKASHDSRQLEYVRQGSLDGEAVAEPIVDDIILVDPVCGMTVDRASDRHLAEHEGVVYAFCRMGCRTAIIREPATDVGAAAPSEA